MTGRMHDRRYARQEAAGQEECMTEVMHDSRNTGQEVLVCMQARIDA